MDLNGTRVACHAAAMTTSPAADHAADGSPQPDSAHGPWPTVAAVVAFLLLAPVGFFYAASGLLMPGPWLFLLWVLFVVLVVLAVLLARRRSYWVLAVPVLGGAFWWGFVSAGEAWLGWTG
jgi:hypothetical protein